MIYDIFGSMFDFSLDPDPDTVRCGCNCGTHSDDYKSGYLRGVLQC